MISSPLYTRGAWVQLAGANRVAEMRSLGKDVIPDPLFPGLQNGAEPPELSLQHPSVLGELVA